MQFCKFTCAYFPDLTKLIALWQSIHSSREQRDQSQQGCYGFWTGQFWTCPKPFWTCLKLIRLSKTSYEWKFTLLPLDSSYFSKHFKWTYVLLSNFWWNSNFLKWNLSNFTQKIKNSKIVNEALTAKEFFLGFWTCPSKTFSNKSK